jgi:hypothetical protein
MIGAIVAIKPNKKQEMVISIFSSILDDAHRFALRDGQWNAAFCYLFLTFFD